MSNKEILEKAIQKAIDGGWSFPKELPQYKRLQWIASDESVAVKYDKYDIVFSTETIIFNHGFAKALWGEAEVKPELGKVLIIGGMNKAWQYHLKRMVIADDPIIYLGDNLPK